MSTKSAESRDNSPEGDGDAAGEKRASKKRKVLSCYACRNRKMKCDRIYPVCGRCQRTGRADQCTYDPRLLEDLPVNGDGHVEPGAGVGFVQPDSSNSFAASANASEALTWKLRVQERRLNLLEETLASLNKNKDPFSSTPTPREKFLLPSDEPKVEELMMFRGKGFKTQFYGSTSPFSLFSQFSELQVFTREAIFMDTSMGRIRTDFKTFRNRRKALVKEQSIRTHGTDAEIVLIVPDKNTVSAAAAIYFQRFEDTYRILHEPTFWKEYNTFWDHSNNDDRSTSFAATLIYIVAITKCVTTNAETNQETVFIGDSSADRESATNLVDACDAWLMRHSRKHLTLAFFQLQCLSLLAKRVNCIKMKQYWVNSGETMRLAIAAGLHRNPDLVVGGRISQYDKEMRRRIWATIMELELQSSVDAGLQSSLCGLHVDAQAPANLPDDAFTTESQQIPATRPKDHFTRTSYLTCSLESLPLRVHLMQLLNNPTTDLQYADVLHYDNQITSQLAPLPKWNDAGSTLPSALLDVQLRQFLLILHRPYAKLASKNARFSYSLTACVNAAGSIISVHDELANQGKLFLNHLRNDMLRAVITLSQAVYHNSVLTPVSTLGTAGSDPVSESAQQGPQPADDDGSRNILKHFDAPKEPLQIPQLPKHDFLTATLCTTAIDLMDRARVIFEQKVMRLGTGYMETWLISAAIGIMPSTPTTPATTSSTLNSGPEDIRSRGRKAIERVTSLCFRVLAMQKDPANDFASSLRMTVTGASPSEMRSTVSSGFSGHTPLSSGPDAFQPLLPGATGMAVALDENAKNGMGFPGAWSNLQDMQADVGGWSLPDFWSFDFGDNF